MTTRNKLLTAKGLGLAEDVKLSTQYSNTEECFRTVSDHVLGYYVVPGGRSTSVSIAPIYQANTWICRSACKGRATRRKPGRYIVASYEIGEYLNGGTSELDEAGNALAKIAADALAALERHSAQRAARSKRNR